PLKLEAPAGERDRRLRQINARVDSARARETRPVRPQPAADLKDAQALRLIEARGRGDVPLRPVAVLLDGFEEAARAYFGVGELRATRVLLPERAHALLQIPPL